MDHCTYIRKGKRGKGAVLFIHGFMGSPRHFEAFYDLVPKDMTVCSILLPGHGGSADDFGHSSMKQWQRCADTYVRKLCRYCGNVWITAHSMGTFFAYDAAVRYPDNIKGIFALASPLKIFIRPQSMYYTFKSFFPYFCERDERIRQYAESHSVKLTFRFWQYLRWIPRCLELFCESGRASETLSGVRIPVEIYQSAKDELVSLRSLKCVPDKENIVTYVLEKSAHFIYDSEDMRFLLSQFVHFIK